MNKKTSKEEIIKFEDHENIFIDYRNLLSLLKVRNKRYHDSIDPVNYIHDGYLLKFSNENWVKPYRLDISEKISLYAKNLAQVFIEQKQWDKVGLIGNKLLLLNSIFILLKESCK